MSRESRIFNVAYFQNTQEVISQYESFGWELLSVNGDQLTIHFQILLIQTLKR